MSQLFVLPDYSTHSRKGMSGPNLFLLQNCNAFKQSRKRIICLNSKCKICFIHHAWVAYNKFCVFTMPLCFIAIQWVRLSGKRLSSSLVASVKSGTGMKCTATCQQSIACDCVNYRPSDKTCEMITLADPLKATAASVVNNVLYEYWRPSYVSLV
jgi:PAN domain